MDKTKTDSHAGQVKDPPWSPPLVQVSDETVAYLLCWEQHERDGSWHAWVTLGSVSRRAGPPPFRERPGGLRTSVGAARRVPAGPRRVLGNDGTIRPWTAK